MSSPSPARASAPPALARRRRRFDRARPSRRVADVSASPARDDATRRRRRRAEASSASSASASSSSADTVASSLRVGVVSGAAAAASCQLLLFPLNTLKTRAQARALGARMTRDDLRMLYRGLVPDLFGAVPGTALFMATYETAKRNFGQTPARAAAAGALAASVVLAPMEVISRRMQVGRMSLMTAVRLSVRKRDLFLGFESFLTRELSFDCVQMSAFEAMKRATLTVRRARDPNASMSARETAAIGGVAGCVTGVLTTPFDVSRTAAVCASSLGIDPKTFPKGLAGVKHLANKFGWTFFFRGAAPRALEIGLGGIIYFSALEATRVAIEGADKK